MTGHFNASNTTVAREGSSKMRILSCGAEYIHIGAIDTV